MGSSDAKAAEEAEAAKKAKEEVIAGVVEFFETEKFVARDEDKSVESMLGVSIQKSNSEKYIYDKFEYNKETETLVYAEMYNFILNLRASGKASGGARTTLSIYEIDLKSCKSVIAVRPLAGTSLISVRLTGKYRAKKIEKKEEWGDVDLAVALSKQISVMATDEDLKSLIKKDFEKTEEDAEILFKVTPEMAPRIKSALADLLEVHGVKALKY